MHGNEIQQNNAPSPRADRSIDRRNRALAASVLRFDLSAELEGLRGRPSYGNGAPTGTTLVKEPNLRIVLMAMRAGARMEEHTASGPISIQGLEGRFRLYLPDGAVELNAGSLLALEPAIPHDVEALEDGAFLLSIGRTTYGEVSDHHERRG